MLRAADVIVGEIATRRAPAGAPLLVALDGPAGGGKSSVADLVAQRLDAALVPSDDFFAGLPDVEWERRSAAERARDCIDWRRLRREALEPLSRGRPGEWRPFDWEAGPRRDGSYGLRVVPTRIDPRPVVLVDGAYSSRPELADLLDLTVLVDAPEAVRRARMAKRDGRDFLEPWQRRWAGAETHYFTEVRPRSSFDLVVENG